MSKKYVKGLAVLALLTLAMAAGIFADEKAEVFIPPQFRVWGTTVPAHAEKIVMPEGYREVLPEGVDLGPEFTGTEDDKKAGFRIYRVNCFDNNLHPKRKPDPAILADPVMKAFATWNEYEPMALGVYGVKRTLGMRARIGDLADGSGHRIPAACLDLRWVKFMPVSLGPFVYKLHPMLLERRAYVDVMEGESAFLWLTVYVPAGTPGGLYSGVVELEPAGTFPAQKAEVSFRVLPFRLDETRRLFSMLYGLNWGKNVCGNPNNFRNEFIDMKEHGMNHVAYAGTSPANQRQADGTWKFFFDTPHMIGARHITVVDIVETAMAVGLDKAYFPNYYNVLQYNALWCGYKWQTPESDEYYKSLFKAWKDEARNRGWPKIIQNIGDEPSPKSGRLQAVVYLGGLAKASGKDIQTSCFCSGQYLGYDDVDDFKGNLDVVISSPGSKKYVEHVKGAGKMLIFYNLASPHKHINCRYAYGYIMENTGADGQQSFMYRNCESPKADDPAYGCYHYLGPDGLVNADTTLWVFSWPTDDGLLPGINFEAIREGIDDTRYIETLQNLIARAKKDGDQAGKDRAGQYEKDLAALMQSFTPFNAEGNNRGDQWLEDAGSPAFDHARYKIALMILDLRQGLGLDGSAAKLTPVAVKGGIEKRIMGVAYKPDGAMLLWPEKKKQAVAGKVPAAPQIDGKLDDACWRGIQKFGGDFIDLGSILGGKPQPAKHQTYFQIGYDAEKIYIAARMLDDQKDSKLPAKPGAGNGQGVIWGDNLLEIYLTPPEGWGEVYHLGINSWGRIVNLHCSRRVDAMIGDKEVPADGISTGISSDEEGWSLEVAIGLKSLGVDRPIAEGAAWGFNLSRVRPVLAQDSSRPSYSSWCLLAKGFNEPWRFGALFWGRELPVSLEWAEVMSTGAGRYMLQAYLRNTGDAPLTKTFAAGVGKADNPVEITVDPGVSVCFTPFTTSDKKFIADFSMKTDAGWLALGGRVFAVPKEAGLIMPGVNDQDKTKAVSTPVFRAMDIPKTVWQGRILPVAFSLPLGRADIIKSSFDIALLQNGKEVFSSPVPALTDRSGVIGLNIADVLPGDYTLRLSDKAKLSFESIFAVIPAP